MHIPGDWGGAMSSHSKLWSNLEPAIFDSTRYYANSSVRTTAQCLPTGVYSTLEGDAPPQRMLSAGLTAAGATAMSRVLPTNPSFGLSRSLGELRNDGLPTIISLDTLKDKAGYLRNSGGEYLNVEFGWLPLVSDLLGFARAVKSSNRVLANFRKGSDRHIRRRYSYPQQTATQTALGSAAVSCNPTGQVWSGASVSTTSYEVEFSGSFKYHVPMGDDLSSQMLRWESEANKLLGSRLTPKLVWDLTPWTWATGWFSNMGSVINNVSSLGSDGLVVEYGYITDRLINVGDMSAWVDWNGKHFSCSSRCTTKDVRRYRATPFGFGFDMTALSPTQDAVLVALGLSHGLR